MNVTVDVPALPGAYVLVIDLADPLTCRLGTRRTVWLPAGRYAYCGSARGPGGLAARIARHLRRDRRDHWHIDKMTRTGRVGAVGYQVSGFECALFGLIADRPETFVPVPGFGSSDCRRCPAHLITVDSDFMPATIGLATAMVS